jgi:hypothetical protein
MTAVFQAANADLTGTAAVGTDVYLADDGTITTTATDNKLLGTIVGIGATSIAIAVA